MVLVMFSMLAYDVYRFKGVYFIPLSLIETCPPTGHAENRETRYFYFYIYDSLPEPMKGRKGHFHGDQYNDSPLKLKSMNLT